MSLAQAQNTTWTAGSGDFTTNANWSNGAAENKEWFINNGGTAELSVTTFPLGGFLGFDPGESGNLSILNNGYLYGRTNLAVGRGGSGVLTIEAGGRVEREGVFVAAGTGSQGSIQINGGELNLSDILHVGYRGTGSLTLTDNGTILSDKADIGGFDTSMGTATITDGLWQNTTALFVGVDGNGTLTVNAQGAVASESLYIGQAAGSIGSVTVAGGNITTTNTLAVGVLGNGELNVTNGGAVNANFFQVALGPDSTGTATVSGNASLVTSQVQIGLAAGSTGTIALSGNAALTANQVQVGLVAGSSGTLTLASHVSLNTPIILVANESGSTGVLNVNGTTLAVGQLVGGSGTATANLNDGTTLGPFGPSNPTLSINGFAAGQLNLSGNVTFASGTNTIDVFSPVSGTGQLIKTGSGVLNLAVASTYSGGTSIQGGTVSVGASNALGNGTIAIATAELRASANATISSEMTVQANQTTTFSASTGTVLTLTPSSFRLNGDASLVAGSSGSAGTVHFAPGALAALPPSSGGVAVNFGTLRAGNTQLASLTVQVGTTTVATGATLDFQDHLAPGGINNLQGNGTVNIGSSASTLLTVVSGNFSGTITGAGGLVKASNGILILSGFSQFTGGTTVDEGTLIVNGALDTGLGIVEVLNGGTLGGTGFVGPVTLSGGTLSPGNSPGTFFPTEILWQDGDILFELGPTQPTSDFINTGKLAGLGSTYPFTFVDQGLVNGGIYNLISFDPTLAPAIPIESFTFTNGGGFNGTFSYRSESANTSFLQFTVAPETIPEPFTWALIALASILLAVRRVRCRNAAK